ncbi:hypothetical protein [Zavarzinia sp.]|uniref:hypothetical protein n=1 Tax=Zavarzinia sp. TaxID=2027920 RepID=UPI003BB56C59
MENKKIYNNSYLDKPSLAIQRRGLLVAIIFLVLIILNGIFSTWPEVYGFKTNPASSSLSRLIEAPIHLSDDVMISLRSGYILKETGIPSFNIKDIAQPSTSYVSPYLFASLLYFLPENIAVLTYSMLGAAAVAATFCFIFYYSRSRLNALIIIGALFITKTNLSYSMNGWDHLFQALFLVIATCFSLKNLISNRDLFIAGLSLALGSLFRPDGIIIASAIFLVFYFQINNFRRIFKYLFLPFSVILSIFLILNYFQFGTFVPTTARLKVGSSPSLFYAIKYAISNGLFLYTALTVFLVEIFFVFFWKGFFLKNKSILIVYGCLLTGAISFYNSDVFSGARMFWLPASVVAALVAISAPSFFVFNQGIPLEKLNISQDYSINIRKNRFNFFNKILTNRSIAASVLFLFLAIFLGKSLIEKAQQSVISSGTVGGSPTAQQYVIAKWIDDNLEPKDGAVGFFYLGVSYHLPRFEIADFLGKADEVIASSKVKWGPPGHNKWDIEKTLNKWSLQAIVPPGPSDPNIEGSLDAARKALAEKRDFGFSPALRVSQNVSEKFVYCYVPESFRGVSDKWGFYLKRDIAKNHSALTCDQPK